MVVTLAWAAAQAASIEGAPRPVGGHIACPAVSVRCGMVTESIVALGSIIPGGKWK